MKGILNVYLMVNKQLEIPCFNLIISLSSQTENMIMFAVPPLDFYISLSSLYLLQLSHTPQA